jgi:3-oxoacyl-[acyl-carrier protein] reductase
MTRRVALLNDASFYVGPEQARELARRGHDLVLGDPAPGLVEELEALGAAVEVVTGVHFLQSAEQAQALVDAALRRFGRIDAASVFSGQILVGRFMDSSVEDLHKVLKSCLDAPYYFLKAVTPVMVAQGEGQILVITSASAARPTFGAPLYSTARAAATMLARNVAEEVVRSGVQVNVVGTNYMDFPEFLQASGATDPEVRKKIESQVPMRRLGTLEEFASFCMPYLDGTSRFTTGQFVAFAGGWV